MRFEPRRRPRSKRTKWRALSILAERTGSFKRLVLGTRRKDGDADHDSYQSLWPVLRGFAACFVRLVYDRARTPWFADLLHDLWIEIRQLVLQLPQPHILEIDRHRR
jgi:hypothetical protein